MGRLLFSSFQLALLVLVGFVSCGTLSLNSTSKATSLTTEATVTAGSTITTTTAFSKTPEPTVTSGTSKVPGSTTSRAPFPSSTTTAKPLLSTSSSNNSSSLPVVDSNEDFADDLVQAQAPIEEKLPTVNCKAAAFGSLFSSASAPAAVASTNLDSGILSLASRPRSEKIFVRIPTEECPPEVMLKTITALNNLRHCQALPEMAHSASLAADAKQWASETASRGVVYKPDYRQAGQYATSTAGPYALFSLELTHFDVLGKWKGSGNNYLPWFTGSGTARHFTNDEWRRVREFGVGCAAYRYKTAKAMFWTVVFFRKA